MNSQTPRTSLPDRLVRAFRKQRGWPRPARIALIRKIVAIALLLLAGALAVRPPPATGEAGEPLLVAARDLAPGSALRPADIRMAELPVDAHPTGALTNSEAALGQTLTSAARAGEPITDARLIGPANTALTTGTAAADTTAVPVRLADSGVAELLRPGMRVDLVTTQEHAGAADPLARDATVLTVITDRDDHAEGAAQEGTLAILALPDKTATQVAGASLTRAVTVTLR
ncbi:Flp pilus assembly protein CpaB [Tamaricihabitans halophyticus]|uniref:Flp pilus assembly protein CpaB n=1 Tax=Tamaricihabitans halophyticus TaxID=1262583 RepID=A0A4R2QT05_9PSEU|nr:Flp pilus assembly protein CpaB [Tamaricihabitans halophyticus]TCP53043.1 Flp pilus assembly protein CpaB [Tamaricihabitans halophyticus]